MEQQTINKTQTQKQTEMATVNNTNLQESLLNSVQREDSDNDVVSSSQDKEGVQIIQDSEDDVMDQDDVDQQETLSRPKDQQIGQDQCFQDDSIHDSDAVYDQEEQSMIYDSQQQQQKINNQKKQQNNNQINEKSSKSKNKINLYDYQNILFKRSLNKNRIIYLPTGKGKTLVSIASMYYYLCKEDQNKKIIFLANTIQLVKQQADSIKRNLQKIMNDDQLSNSLIITEKSERIKVKWTAQQIKKKICCIHGEKKDEIGMTRRKKIQAQLSSKKQILQMFKSSKIIVMIAQMFLNCLRRGYIKITDFSFMVFDECHHCHGSHPYAGIMRQFYFDPPKLDPKAQKQYELFQKQEKLPIIMGLSASPVMQQSFDKNKLIKELDELCGNLNSRFTPYQSDKTKSNTSIQIIKTQQLGRRQAVPDLIAHFQKFRDHREAYNKIKKHFPQFFQCVEKIIDFLKSKYQTELNLEADPYTISNIQLLLFYDIKQCLLVKLRDVWLELGQYAFSIAFQQLYSELGKINLKMQQNKQILQEVINIIKQYVSIYKQKFGYCQPKYFSAKVKKLIELLSQKKNQSSNQFEMVVIFASKRRTVKYLDRLIKDYKETLPQEQRRCFDCDRVTGYSVKSAVDYSKNQVIFQGDPSSHRFEAEAQHRYASYLNDLAQEKNRPTKMENQQSSSKNLANQLKRMRSVKYGKLLLEVQEKYSAQIQTIKRFRAKKFRVLITTSVTQEGFDIPECKIVISFDIPSSLKSYIQIKGRARQLNSQYFIFTNERNNKQMHKNRNFYDDIINATFQVAMSKFSQDSPQNEVAKKKPAIITQQEGYKKIIVRQSGALINTSYALEILKMYCASLRQPNKLKFYFVETPNISFRCLIHFPQSAPISKPYIIGQSKSNKNSALKSAAFQAIKYLYVQKYLKSDLRPKKYQELEDQREIQKFQDLQYTRKNEQYKIIFQNDVRVSCDKVDGRKFMRFYFRAIKSQSLDFPNVNSFFKEHQKKFQKQKFPFQIYMMNFSNSRNMRQLRKDQQSQQVGVLTCFQQKYIEQIFSGYQYTFEQNSSQKFTLRLEQQCMMLNKSQYQRLKRIHQFLISASLSRQVYHYCQLTGKKPLPNRWVSQYQKSKCIYREENRQFYPLLVVIIKKNGKYTLDQQCIKRIQDHQNLFKQIYEFHNISNKLSVNQKFKKNLKNQYEVLLSQINENKMSQGIIVQSIQRQHCFSKCIISGKQMYYEDMEKDRQKKRTLVTRNKKLSSMFQHCNQEIKEVVKIVFWNKYKKEKKKEIFERDCKLTIQNVQNPRYFVLGQFVVYPLNTSILFKLTLATQFLFKAVFQYSLAFQFRNHKLPSIYHQKIKDQTLKKIKPFVFESYPSIILQNANSLFSYLADNSGSSYLRHIGKSYKQGSKFSKPIFDFSYSKINMDQSSIGLNKTNNNNQSMNMSSFHLSQIIEPNAQQSSMILQKSVLETTQERSLFLLQDIKVTQLLKVLTSKMYKFSKIDNYEQYEFIGDVVLKLLSTVQIFLEKPAADESQLHISRANIICNSNLHRKSILKKIYEYILSKKIEELPPPYAYTPIKQITETFYEKSTFKIHNENSQLEGFHYIPGKVHADIIQGLIGAFYLHSKQLNDCQALLYCLDILKKPSIKIEFDDSRMSDKTGSLPQIYVDLQKRINYQFKNKGILLQSMTHSSFKSVLHTVIDKNNIQEVYTNAKKKTSNQLNFSGIQSKKFNESISTKTVPWETFYERLQFLGDSILDLIVVQYLHDKYGTKDEGTLSSLKQAGVSNKTLGMIAISLGMHELILMDHQQNDKVMKEFKQIQLNFDHFLNNPQALMDYKFNSIKILGDVFEALVGAIFIDLQLDYIQAKLVILKIIYEFLQHYTDIQNLQKGSSFKYQQYLKKNNYRDCQLKKDTTTQIQNGNFRYLLIDRSGIVIEECWQTTEKRAWDLMVEKFYKKVNQNTNP